MAEKTEENFDLWGTSTLVAKRLLAAKVFYSGTIEKLRTDRMAQGAPPWTILQYQRVIEPKNIPLPLRVGSYVKPKTFEKHLRYLKEHCKPCSLEELANKILSGEEVDDKTVVLTLDGGSMDSFFYAVPLLLKYQIPATFFMPVGYIESHSFSYDDRIAMALFYLKEKGEPLPKLNFLPEEFETSLRSISVKREITEETLRMFITALHRVSHAQRIAALELLGGILGADFTLPEYQDFMSWNDLQDLERRGFSIGSQGFGGFQALEVSPQEFAEDFMYSFKTLRERELKPAKAFCFPEGAFTLEQLAVLAELQVPIALTLGEIPAPPKDATRPVLLGRVPIAEENSFCTEFFACRLWGVELAGLEY